MYLSLPTLGGLLQVVCVCVCSLSPQLVKRGRMKQEELEQKGELKRKTLFQFTHGSVRKRYPPVYIPPAGYLFSASFFFFFFTHLVSYFVNSG